MLILNIRIIFELKILELAKVPLKFIKSFKKSDEADESDLLFRDCLTSNLIKFAVRLSYDSSQFFFNIFIFYIS